MRAPVTGTAPPTVDLAFVEAVVAHQGTGREAVIDNLAQKMVRRHPHVFEDSKADTPDAVIDQWEHIKIALEAKKIFKQEFPMIGKALDWSKDVT